MHCGPGKEKCLAVRWYQQVHCGMIWCAREVSSQGRCYTSECAPALHAFSNMLTGVGFLCDGGEGPSALKLSVCGGAALLSVRLLLEAMVHHLRNPEKRLWQHSPHPDNEMTDHSSPMLVLAPVLLPTWGLHRALIQCEVTNKQRAARSKRLNTPCGAM